MRLRGLIQAFLTMLPNVVNPDVSAFISSEKRIFLLRTDGGRWEAKGSAAVWSGVAREMMFT